MPDITLPRNPRFANSTVIRRVTRSSSASENCFGSIRTPACAPPNGVSTHAHLNVIKAAHAVTESAVTSEPNWMPGKHTLHSYSHEFTSIFLKLSWTLDTIQAILLNLISLSFSPKPALVSVLDFKDECCLQAVSKWNAYGYRPFHQQSYTISYRLCTEFGGDYAVLAMPRRSRTCRCLVWSERTCPARNYTALLCPVYLGRSTTSQRASACRSQRLSDDFLPGQRPCRRICSQYR